MRVYAPVPSLALRRGERRGGLVVQGRVRPTVVVVQSPGQSQGLGLLQVCKYFNVEQFISDAEVIEMRDKLRNAMSDQDVLGMIGLKPEDLIGSAEQPPDGKKK